MNKQVDNWEFPQQSIFEKRLNRGLSPIVYSVFVKFLMPTEFSIDFQGVDPMKVNDAYPTIMYWQGYFELVVEGEKLKFDALARTADDFIPIDTWNMNIVFDKNTAKIIVID